MENPTPQEGASIQERLERFLEPEVPSQPTEAEEPAEVSTEVDVEVEPQEGAGEEANEPSIALSDLAQYLGIEENFLDVDDDGKVLVRTKIDGQEGKTKLNDLLTSYQLKGHLDNETRAVAEQRKAMQAQMAEIEQAVQARVQQIEDMANVAQYELNRQFQNIDWQSLRVNDPAEYAAQLADFQARQGQIQNLLQSAQQQRQQQNLQQQTAYQQGLQQEAQLLTQIIPEWSAPEVAEKERDELKTWGKKQGLSDVELNSVSRAAHVAILRKAMLYDRLQQTKSTVENKVRTAPKLVKPGQAPDQSRGETTLRNIKANVKKTGGSRQSVMDYLIATNKV